MLHEANPKCEFFEKEQLIEVRPTKMRPTFRNLGGRAMKKFCLYWTTLILWTVWVTPCKGDPPVDVILEWNSVALEANALDHTGPDVPGDQLTDTQGPPASARALAMVHVAMFDAYNSVRPKYTPYLFQHPNATSASPDAAVAQAAHDVLAALIPEHAAFYDSALQETLERVANPWKKRRGIRIGKQIAAVVLAARAGDAPFLGGSYTPTGQIGDHDVDPKNPDQSFISPLIGGMNPFGVPEVLPYRATPPPSLTSSEYAMAFDEVRILGEFRGGDSGTVVPTDDPTYVVANYWSYNGSPLIGTPPRLYNQIARVIAKKKNNRVHQNARLFALLNIAMADGGISAWDTKYFFEYWRPILGIRLADLDGNPFTVPDPKWCALGGSRSNPFLPGETNFTPPFPGYTSGHATFGAAAFKTLANFYQRDRMPFIFVSDEWNGVTVDQFGRTRPLIPRRFKRLSWAAAENAASRVFNGVHWRFDGTEGVRAGNAIANYVFDNLLRPRSGGGPTSIPDADFESQIDAILKEALNNRR